MGWFSKPEPTATVRADKVINAIKADMDFESAIDRDVDGAAFAQVSRNRDASMRGLNAAELRRVDEARARHGYGA